MMALECCSFGLSRKYTTKESYKLKKFQFFDLKRSFKLRFAPYLEQMNDKQLIFLI